MSCSLKVFWMANFLFCLLLFLHGGDARVFTDVQAGPLYRVVGARLSIICNVTGLRPTSTRNEFDFRIAKPGSPRPINIINTKDSSFPFFVYLNRVRSGEITLTHVDANSVVFEIQSLEKSDEGEYECGVFNPYGVFDGAYSGSTTVKVIDNSLSVSSSASPLLSFTEGDPLTLTCQASTNTIQHTHLSFAWFHSTAEDRGHPIIAMDRDFTLIPGQHFEQRYQAGLIRLDKIGEATYRLEMSQLQLSDQGRIYCEAQEWIQDPDRSWYSIAQRTAGEMNLTVKAKEVVPDISSLVVRISVHQTTLQEGQQLSVSCSIDTQREKFFSVAWLHEGVELARIGPTGILTVGPDYRGREQGGELRAARIGEKEYRLMVQPVRINDQGEYMCKAWPQDWDQTGVFTLGAPRDSSPQSVSISATENGLSVEMQNSVSVKEGDRLELTCKVGGVKDQLSVTWQHKSASKPGDTIVISLSQEGVMEKGEDFINRKVKATRPAHDTFNLELEDVTPSDSGGYQCAVSEWKTNSKTNSASGLTTVTVKPLDTFAKVSLKSRNNKVTVGETVELICLIRQISLPITLTWSLQRDDLSVNNIVTVYSNGTISWSAEQYHYQLRIQKKTDGDSYYLIINGASFNEAGRYQCEASVFLQNVYKKLQRSNQLGVKVEKPEPKLILTSTPTLTRSINTDIEMKCSATSPSAASSRYAVTWLLWQQAENKTIISSNRDALVTFGPQVELSQMQRISTSRKEGPDFYLTIRQARTSDKGLYVCKVVEWIRDPRGEWFHLPPISKSTHLTITEPANDLELNKENQSLNVMEGVDVELHCSLISAAVSPFIMYRVIWRHTRPNSSIISVPLVELDHTGLLTYPSHPNVSGLQQRLRLSREAQSSFHLWIQKAHEGDSGTYECQVEQYQLDQDGRWQQTASDNTGPISLTVDVTGNNLTVLNEEEEFNVSTSQNLTVPCIVTAQSSPQSQFQVTWFWEKEATNDSRPIFTVYRNSTFRYWFGDSGQLKFGHLVSSEFSLTVLKPYPENSGRYFCEVEEWIPSVSHGWRKVTVERSGYLVVNIYNEGAVAAVLDPGCNSGSWVGLLGGVLIIALLVIFLLVLKICWSKSSGGQKAGPSLWAEQHPLNNKPSPED